MTSPRQEGHDAPLPKWMGITEPATVATDLLLGVVAMALAARLGYGGAADGVAARVALGFAFLATAVAALFGAMVHAIDPQSDAEARRGLWRVTLHVTGFVSAAIVVAVGYFAADGRSRTALLWLAGVQLAWYSVAVARRPTFRVAVIDYGAALGVVFVAAVYAYVRWRAPGMGWLIGAVLVSLAAGLVQGMRLAPHRWFNHNDLYHVIQMVALYLFYRGGVLLADR